jgi:MFS family permease
LSDQSTESVSKPARFFYGWVMLGVAVLMAMATMPSQTVIVSLFNLSFQEKLGLSVAELSLAYTVGTIIAAFPLSWVGKAADKFGIRAVALVIVMVYALALIVLHEAIGIVTLGMGFFCIRFLGQGSLGMLSGHTIAMWFERKLGLAHSVLAVGGFALGSAVMPKPVAWMIGAYGPERTMMYLGIGVVVVIMPLLVFVFRNKPEDIGQHLDGDESEHLYHDVAHGGSAPIGDPAFTLAQTRRTGSFWILLTLSCTSGCIGTALLFHMQNMILAGGDERLASLSVAELASVTAGANQMWAISFGLGMLCTGWLADKFKPRVLLPIAPLMMMLGSLVCWYGATGRSDDVVQTMKIGMLIYGVGMAVSVAVGSPAIARFFGRTHHGAIRGFMTSFGVAATGLAPYLAGKWYELAGENFGPVLIAFAVWCVPLIVLTAMLKRPTPPVDRDLNPDPDPVDMHEVEL